MAFLFRWSMRALVALIVLALAAAGLAYYLAGRSLPDYDRALTLAGVEAPFEIVRDRHAVPHILAGTDADAFFGLGFVHAQDRLWQMMLLRRTAQGRLSELFGAETVEIDHLMRALDLYGFAQGAARDQTPETTRALEAYADGVNARLRQVQDEALGRGAPEFFLFEARIAPWVPTDSIAVQKLMALNLTDKAALEVVRARLSLLLPPERLRDLMPDAPETPGLALPQFGALFPDVAPSTELAALRHPLDPLPPPGRAGASNAFAASGRRAAGGAPLLATDPHLALGAPSIWMLARMDLAEGPVMGGTIPGIPAVLVGRNDRLAWGLTSSYVDDQDIVIEALDPDDPTRYRTASGYRPFRSRETVIAVRNAADLTVTLRWTSSGPVLPPHAFGVGAVTPPGHAASLAWTALSREDRSIGAAIALMRAGSVREGEEAARDHLAPSLMLTLADAETIGTRLIGKVATRDPRHSSAGRIPAPGWVGGNRWIGIAAPPRGAGAVDPPGGIVVHTNDPLEAEAFPDHLSHDWGDSHRILRASRLLNAREFHTLESFVEAQTDTVSEPARVLLPLIARDLWYSGEAAAAGSPEARRQAALERLANWNGEMSEHLPEPLIYASWVRALQRRLIVDELGSLAALRPVPDPVFLERVFRDVDGAAVWCDVIQSSPVETCTEIARRALDDALTELEARFGPRIESWRWGDAHQALHRHDTLGAIPVLQHLVNIRQSTPGGDHTLLRGMMPATGLEPYLNVHAAGLRMVVDFADPEASVIVIATGQSGHPLSRHYDDFAALWRRGEYVPMSLDASLARAGARGVTRIAPASALSE
jgi:penicillin G amidase